MAKKTLLEIAKEFRPPISPQVPTWEEVELAVAFLNKEITSAAVAKALGKNGSKRHGCNWSAGTLRKAANHKIATIKVERLK